MSTSIYTSNKYNSWYFSIISKAQSENRTKGGDIYYENHHILPKSLGGSNNKDNLVLLTAREHYLCHYLLTKFTSGEYKTKMIFAFNLMNSSSNFHQRYKNSKLFEKNKILLSKIQKERYISNNTRIKMSKSAKNKTFSNTHKQNLSKSKLAELNPFYGKHHSIEAKLKISMSKQTSQLGKNNWQFSGYYITPWGKFETAKQASTNIISYTTIKTWCKTPNKIITQQSINTSKYLRSLPSSPLGKTYEEIGFLFETI